MTDFTYHRLLFWLVDHGVTLEADNGRLRFAPADLPPEILKSLAEHKARLLEWLETDLTGPPADDLELLSPAEVGTCTDCGRLNSVQTADQVWHCGNCDPQAEERAKRTQRILMDVNRIRARHAKTNISSN